VIWVAVDIERVATELCLTDETYDFRRGVIALAVALGVMQDNLTKLNQDQNFPHTSS